MRRSRQSSAVLPLWAKLAYTAFVAVLVPHYWQAYGPTNFLYFCDIALLMTCVAMWTESALLASACAVGILLPQLLWMIDFVATAMGMPVTGMTGYMFQDAIPLFARFLSFFHFWLPIVLLWLVLRLGYDRRGLWLWWVVAWAAMWVSYLFLPMPPAPVHEPGLPVNVNYVFGINDRGPQTWMPKAAFFALMLAALPAVIWVPTHMVLARAVRLRD
ncbi:MAG: hypothetical protein HY836_10770 [Aquabacterium sp.]|uniref:hypothetical protein n=1 Tax=Aquabacterium sp. TaxID=1872578 RepID=UPI0025B8DA49|nr:hypothetical protein [Aquabacterium sp.]MBI5926070.1 hypothetical protein [Aquabacterium sp.]